MAFLTGAYLELVAHRRRGLFADILRALLAVVAVPYAAVVIIRNTYYDLFPGAAKRVDAPVISIGNLTVGGTGKTPIAAAICQRLADRGRKPAILLRGYKSKASTRNANESDAVTARWREKSDEAMVLARRCPGAAVLVDPDRVASGRRAIHQGADVLVLDDGFQHRRLARDLDIVLIDATAPFGHGHFLPRGLLREPPTALRRADLVVLTRSNEVDGTTRSLIQRTLRRLAKDRPIIEATHSTHGFLDLSGRPVQETDPTDMQAVLFAGIANFESFRRSVERLGVRVLAAYQYPDHHPYSAEELTGLADVAGEMEANILLTTEKDAVKIEGRWDEKAPRLLALNLAVEFPGDGDKILADAIDRILRDA
ncbi:MAG TPA: tetraacyldisaccharide 4'-kinase [Phycisphaerae bacterium]|nr:tetraacyldisaccharide 4'-kinase [Phycisphaerae bacterium]